MCGRYVIAPPDEEILKMIREINRTKLAEMFREANQPPVTGAGEIFPSSVVPVIATSRTGERRFFPMKWGFRQNDADGKRGKLLINARAETAAEKPTFRESWLKHRCIIPASWYCEWERDEQKKPGRKYSIRPVEKGIIWLAGLYHMEEGLPAFVILTRPADSSLSWMHDRMPVMFTEENAGLWIRPEARPEELIRDCLTKTQWEYAG